MRRVGFALAVVGRQGPILLVASLVIGACSPALAGTAHDVLPLAAFLLTLGSFLTAALSPAEPAISRPRLYLALAWIGAGVPLCISLLIAPLDLDPALRSGVILSIAAPPVGSAAALAAMLGLRPRLALSTSIALTVAAPALMPLLAMLLHIEASLDVGRLAWRLIVIVGSAAVLAELARRWAPRLTSVLPDAQAGAGVAVIGLTIVGLAVMDGLRTHLAAAPDVFGAFIGWALVVNLGTGFAGSVLFWLWGSRNALTIGLVSGNRNVTLAWAAAGMTLGAPGEAYIAACVIPILSLPLALKIGFAVWGRMARLRSAPAAIT